MKLSPDKALRAKQGIALSYAFGMWSLLGYVVYTYFSRFKDKDKDEDTQHEQIQHVPIATRRVDLTVSVYPWSLDRRYHLGSTKPNASSRDRRLNKEKGDEKFEHRTYVYGDTFQMKVETKRPKGWVPYSSRLYNYLFGKSE